MSKDNIQDLYVERLIEKYAAVCKRNALEMATMPIEAVCQHFREFAYEIIAFSEPVKNELVGVAGTMPGTNGFTMACFPASDVPVGTKLYTLTAEK